MGYLEFAEFNEIFLLKIRLTSNRQGFTLLWIEI